ncbi:MAG TPA: dethiobiotin synthase [Mycobacteriales bacterium]|nr:dethiobiotin synthase [Mycobacteriales bacterium]
MSIVVVSATGTGVGKTVVSAALVSVALHRGRSVAYVKVAQTGSRLPAPADRDTVCRLSGLHETSAHVGATFPEPMSPEAAARAAEVPPVQIHAVAELTLGLATRHDLVVVEGAGGLLVRFDSAGTTLADLAGLLDAPVIVVVAAGLGTLNHTALTLEALAHRGLPLGGVVIGSWPRTPGQVERSNVADLETAAAQPLAGALPARAAGLGVTRFREAAVHGLSPAYGGTFDSAGLLSSSRSGPPARA